MRVLIHQPHFLPWLPYVARLLAADRIVFLDDAQYQEGYFHNRTVFLNTSSQAHWVTIPVRGDHGCSLAAARACESRLLIKSARFIENTYAKGTSEALRAHIVRSLQVAEGESLASLNIALIERVAAELGMQPLNAVRSSGLALPEDRTDRLIEICRFIGATALLNGWGEFASEHDLPRLRAAGIRIFVQNKEATLAPLAQLQPRPPGLSVLHDIFRYGPERTADVIHHINRTAHVEL